MTQSDACGICRANAAGGELYQDEHWLIRRMPPGVGVPGWVMVNSKRHVPGIAHFNDDEAADFGPAFRRFARTLEEVTGALRVYTAAMGESFPHFHAHLVPRYEHMPNDAAGWAVFDLYRATQAGEVTVDEGEAARIADAYGQALTQLRSRS